MVTRLDGKALLKALFFGGVTCAGAWMWRFDPHLSTLLRWSAEIGDAVRPTLLGLTDHIVR